MARPHLRPDNGVQLLQFVAEPRQALAEFCRVLIRGGHIGIVNWAEAEASDVHMIEAAVAAATGQTFPPDDELRQPGGLLAVLVDAGLEVVDAGLIRVPWAVADEQALAVPSSSVRSPPMPRVWPLW